MTELELNIEPVAQDLVTQLKNLVPVRTGRLKNSIQYQIRKDSDGYVISLIMEDYFKWLKVRTRSPKLPTAKEMAMANPPLPKMNDLGIVKQEDLSARSKGIMDRIDIMEALSTMDKSFIEEQIKDIIAYDKL